MNKKKKKNVFITKWYFSKIMKSANLGYRINVHVRLLFFRSISPLYNPVLTLYDYYLAFFLQAFLHFLKSESSLIRMFCLKSITWSLDFDKYTLIYTNRWARFTNLGNQVQL